MNRNISMLILLALVIGTILISYNKWIMRDVYANPDSASSQVAVTVGSQASLTLQDAVIDKSTSDTLTSVVPKAVKGENSGTSIDQVPSLKAAVQQKQAPQVSTEKTLTLVTKTVTVAEVQATPAVEDTSSTNVGGSSKERAEKKPAELLPLVSVSYSGKKLTVFATEKFTYEIFGLKEPDRFVVDAVGHFSDELPVPKVAPDSLVNAVRLGHHDDRVRIVLDLKGKIPANWSATQTNGTLSLVLQ